MRSNRPSNRALLNAKSPELMIQRRLEANKRYYLRKKALRDKAER